MPTVLIAGASRGLGLELARQYAADGWQVIAGCRRPEAAGEVGGLDVEVQPLDVTTEGSAAALRATLGDRTLDLLIVVAGIAGGDRQALGGIDYADLAQILETNVAGPLRVAEAFADAMGAGGKLVAISSSMGSIAETTSTDMMLYRISKAALNEAWKCVSIDLAPRGIVATLLHPGWVATDMGGPQAPVSPEDSAEGMRRVIAALGPDDAGGFRDFQGRVVPW